MPSATVIIPQFSRCELTRRCVDTLLEHHPQPPELIIADDGSDPAELAPHLAWFESHTRLLRLSHRGVTAAWNAAACAAQTDWLVLLNNDTTTLGPWIDRLLAPLQAGAAIMTGVAWRIEQHLPQRLRQRRPRPRLLAGWCFAIPRDRLLNLGGFDESLALYFSDTDLQLRLLATADETDPRLSVESLPLLHAGHATAHRLPDHRAQWHRDRRRFLAKWDSSFPASGGRQPADSAPPFA